MRKIEYLADKAEGDCCGVPYNTELVNSNGVNIHFWLGAASTAILPTLERAARNQRDIVSITYCAGEPIGYWAHENFGTP